MRICTKTLNSANVNNGTVLTLYCWGNFDPGCSFWTRRTDWTRKQAGSSRPHGVHIHNHCQTTKQSHTASDQYQHVEKGHIVIQCVPGLIYLFITGELGTVRQTHHYYVLIKATVDKFNSVKRTYRGGFCYHTWEWAVLPASIFNQNMICI